MVDEPRGTARIYALRREGLNELRVWIEGFWDEALERFKQHAESTRDGRRTRKHR